MQVSLKHPPATVLLDEEFEEVKKIMKTGANEVLDKTSDQAKEVFKNQADTMIEKAVYCVIGPIKTANTTVSPGPVAGLVNQTMDACVAPISKKVASHTINKCVDVGARKIADKGIDYSVTSTKSLFLGIYNQTGAYFLAIQETEVEQNEDEASQEGDLNEPVVDETISILEGHIILPQETSDLKN
jgi:hypothetical protein